MSSNWVYKDVLVISEWKSGLFLDLSHNLDIL